MSDHDYTPTAEMVDAGCAEVFGHSFNDGDRRWMLEILILDEAAP